MEPELGEHYNLKWNSHHLETFRAFENHRVNESLVDVILFCDGRVIKAHKLVLSACSAYFEKLFQITGSTSRQPVLIFRDASIDTLRLAVEFMYNGEVEVPSEKLTQFFQLSESLEIKGLRTREEDPPPIIDREESPELEQVEVKQQQPPAKKRRVVSASSGVKQRQRNAVPIKSVKPVVKVEATPIVQSFPPSPVAVGQAVQISDEAMEDKIVAKSNITKSRVPLRSSDSDSGESERAPPGPEHADGSDDAEFAEDGEDHGVDSSFLSSSADLEESIELDRPQYVPPDIVVEGPSPELHGLFRGRDQRGRLVYLCGFCQYTASKKTHGIDHVRIHTGDRPYACSICGRKFTRKQHMRKHEFLHRVKEEGGGIDIVDLGCDSPVESPENGKTSEHDSGNEVDAGNVHVGQGVMVG